MFTLAFICESATSCFLKILKPDPIRLRTNLAFPALLLVLSGDLASGQAATAPQKPTRRASVIKFPARITAEQLDPWSAIEPVAAVSSPVKPGPIDKQTTTESPTASTPLLIIPELIDRPDNIDDQNVAPIPTAPTDAVDSSTSQSLNTTIPVVPESSDGFPKQLSNEPLAPAEIPAAESETSSQSVYDSSPRLVTHSEDAAPTTSDESATERAGVWQLAAAQILATVVGIFIASGIFVLIRLAALKLFGVNLGVTFHVGSTQQTTTLVSSEDESAMTVSFEKPEQSDNSHEHNEKDDPPDSPFRIRHAA